MATTRTKKNSTKKSTKAVKAVKAADSEAAKSNIGKTLGLKVSATWVKILSDNEKASKAKKQTDEQINEFMMAEFPDRTSTDITTVKGVQAVRRAYVRGVFTGGESQESYKYNEEGEKIKPSGKLLEADVDEAKPAVKKVSKKKAPTKKAPARKRLSKKSA